MYLLKRVRTREYYSTATGALQQVLMGSLVGISRPSSNAPRMNRTLGARGRFLLEHHLLPEFRAQHITALLGLWVIIYSTHQ